jgi:drug/metabolite transporter (DMT)-like permease
MYFASLAIVVIGVLIYHAAQKKLPHEASPFMVLSVAYGVALSLTLVLWWLLPGLGRIQSEVQLDQSRFERLQPMLLPATIIGVGALLVEVGFILMYRSGWLVSNASLSANVTASLLLVPIGILVFKESVSPTQLAGFVLGAAGLYLIAKR